ncbi:class I SAM-dependent methyltransferase [Bacillus marinisedimentorum]|uniref:class I SAM-dependent methyltransferase n=1 Tax=Bacillus marinisedimentorum TaxID=1821260 RepID=UPI000873153C|nr:class I SAM-dependent methyltransferase [Bacillus marinisedimentorum]
MTFYEMLTEAYDVIFPLNPKQIEFIASHISPPARVVDVGAGTGIAAVELAAMGFEVTALEPEAGFAEQIKDKAAKQQAAVEVIQDDMRRLKENVTGRFDSIICIGNTLAHLRDRGQIKQMLADFHSLLKESGVLIIQVVNYDHVLQYEQYELPAINRPGHNVSFQRTYDVGENEIHFHGKLTAGGTTAENDLTLFPLTKEILHSGFEDAGFTSIRYAGAFDGRPHTPDAPALIAVARKEKVRR